MNLTQDEKHAALMMAISACIADGNVDGERYITTRGYLTEEEEFFVTQEYRWQAAGLLSLKVIDKAMEK